jgi:hypothetical protein
VSGCDQLLGFKLAGRGWTDCDSAHVQEFSESPLLAKSPDGCVNVQESSPVSEISPTPNVSLLSRAMCGSAKTESNSLRTESGSASAESGFRGMNPAFQACCRSFRGLCRLLQALRRLLRGLCRLLEDCATFSEDCVGCSEDCVGCSENSVSASRHRFRFTDDDSGSRQPIPVHRRSIPVFRRLIPPQDSSARTSKGSCDLKIDLSYPPDF